MTDLFQMVQQAVLRIRGATRPIEVEVRDAKLPDTTTSFGFMVDDAMGDPVSFVVAPMADNLVMLAAYDGRLTEATTSTNLERERVRRMTPADIVEFVQNVLGLLAEGVKLATVHDGIRIMLASEPSYDYDFGAK